MSFLLSHSLQAAQAGSKIKSHVTSQQQPTNHAPLTQVIDVTVNKRPTKSTFRQKVQTHTSPRPSNRHNHNKHHPVNKSPTPLKSDIHGP